MNKILLTLLLTSTAIFSFAQDFSSLRNYQFASASEYKTKEPQVKECANYILTKPYDKNDENRKIATQFIIIWMTGTPDYSFSLGKGMSAIMSKGDELPLSLFMAGMVDYAMINPDNIKDAKAVEKAGVLAVLNYCDNTANNYKPDKKIRKLIEANKKGTLDAELNL